MSFQEPDQPSQLEGAVPSGPGILFVLSTVLLSSPPISPEAFADWYANTHIQEVQSTGCISSTQRYESLAFTASFRGKTFGSGEVVGNKHCDYDFLTVYQMPDLRYRETEAFRGLDGQSAPRRELLEGLFWKVEFVTRFAGLDVSAEPGGEVKELLPTPFIVSIAPLAGGDGKAVPRLEGIEGVREVRRYHVHEGSRLSRFERSWLDEPREMAIVGVESEEGVAAVMKAIGDAEGLEVGYWALRREYDGSERTPKGWNPPTV